MTPAGRALNQPLCRPPGRPYREQGAGVLGQAQQPRELLAERQSLL